MRSIFLRLSKKVGAWLGALVNGEIVGLELVGMKVGSEEVGDWLGTKVGAETVGVLDGN